MPGPFAGPGSVQSLRAGLLQIDDYIPTRSGLFDKRGVVGARCRRRVGVGHPGIRVPTLFRRWRYSLSGEPDGYRRPLACEALPDAAGEG